MTSRETVEDVLREMRDIEAPYVHRTIFADRIERAFAGRAEAVVLAEVASAYNVFEWNSKHPLGAKGFSGSLPIGTKIYTHPPASVPEVTDAMVTGLLREYLRREPSEEGIVELEDPMSREFARGLLTAALQEQRHD